MSIPRDTTPTIEEEDEDITTTTESTMPQTTEIENPSPSGNEMHTDIDEPSSGTTESIEGVAPDPHDLMTSSYTEISFDSDSEVDEGTEAEDYLGERDRTPTILSTTDGSSKVAGSLSLPQLASSIVSWSERAKTEYEEEFGGSSRPDTATDLPSGQYRVEDDGMVSFVADDLEEKLRLSSPTRSVNTSISSGHTEDLNRTSNVQLDAKLLEQMELQALQLNANIVQMMAHISESTHSLSKLTVECTNSYETCLVRTCDSVDANIRSMYYLMSKVEEVNKSMKPITQITEDLNQVKKLLELFEKAIP